MHLDEMCMQFADCVQTDAYHYYDFDYLIRLYSDAFGEENLIVLPYELLRTTICFLTILEEKLGLEHIEPNFSRLNPSLSHEELYWYPVISRWVAAFALRLARRDIGKFTRGIFDKRWRIGCSALSEFCVV